MMRYRATYTRADGTAGALDLVAPSDWAAIDALLSALGDDAQRLRWYRCS